MAGIYIQSVSRFRSNQSEDPNPTIPTHRKKVEKMVEDENGVSSLGK